MVPGFYGTNSVKWLTRMTLADRRATGPFTTTWYNDPVLDGVRQRDRRDDAGLVDRAGIAHRLARSRQIGRRAVEREIWGWAWADGGVRSVHVRAGDNDATWMLAELESPQGREWQRFSIRWCQAGLAR